MSAWVIRVITLPWPSQTPVMASMHWCAVTRSGLKLGPARSVSPFSFLPVAPIPMPTARASFSAWHWPQNFR